MSHETLALLALLAWIAYAIIRAAERRRRRHVETAAPRVYTASDTHIHTCGYYHPGAACPAASAPAWRMPSIVERLDRWED